MPDDDLSVLNGLQVDGIIGVTFLKHCDLATWRSRPTDL
jgi:hypothetical protein